MDVAGGVAIYGALVATASAAWQLVTYWQGNKPRLVITGSSFVFIDGEAEANVFDRALKTDGKSDHGPPFLIEIEIRNTGRVKVQLSRLLVSQLDGEKGADWDLGPWAELPLWLEPGEAVTFPLTAKELAEFSFTARAQVVVRASTGRLFKHRLPAFSLASGKDHHVVLGLPFYQELIKRTPLPPGVMSAEMISRYIVDREQVEDVPPQANGDARVPWIWRP
ncbi:hypothetical protein [Micromonospora sp. WMMD708]|uniref:hypothetical protein n=1 Tax=Micromonospora sp. WMMD708 TaxID=3403464 RepID=UPI003BF45EB9